MILNLVISIYLKIKWSKGIQSCFWVAKVYFKEVKPAFVFDKFIIWKQCNLNQLKWKNVFGLKPLNVGWHPDVWFFFGLNYRLLKNEVQNKVIEILQGGDRWSFFYKIQYLRMYVVDKKKCFVWNCIYDL